MQKSILKIDGMMCNMCEVHISDCIRRNFNVKKVSASHKSGECVIISDAKLDSEKLKAAITETGYDVLSITQAPYEKKKFSFFEK